MSWTDLLIEEPAMPHLGMSGSRFRLCRDDEHLVIVDPAISDCENRADGKTVFVSLFGKACQYLTPDEATAIGMALIKAAAQERQR